MPTGPARLVVQSTPGGVPILMDGSTTSSFTPSGLDLTAGTHTVSLQLLGYRDTVITISLSAAVHETLSVVLDPGPGTPRSFSVWQHLPDNPLSIATGANGPVYVTVGNSTAALLVFSVTGAKLGETSRAHDPTSNLTVTAAGEAYFARNIAFYGSVIERVGSGANLLNTLYDPYLTGPAPWPVSYNESPCPTAGTNDTLEVLLNSPAHAVVGEVHRYLNDQHIDSWLTGVDAGKMVIDGVARRFFFLGSDDTVRVFSTGGQVVGAWRAGVAAAQHPSFMAIAPDGTLYLRDINVILRFRHDGVLLAAWQTGATVGSIRGVAIDGSGLIYVADSSNQAIVRYVP